MRLRPFFCYFGGKNRAAPRYPSPRFNTIVEPFAGAAGYSCCHSERQVFLLDKDPLIAALWEWLIHVPASDVRALPLKVEHVDSLQVCQEARWLIGFWLNKGTVAPNKSPGAWMRGGLRPESFWGETIRERIASQVERIRHWQIRKGSWEQLSLIEATWFVDPPYAVAGKAYKHSNVNYSALADWCLALPGQVIVCENQGADWLPFVSFYSIKSNSSIRGKKQSHEAVWLKGCA